MLCEIQACGSASKDAERVRVRVRVRERVRGRQERYTMKECREKGTTCFLSLSPVWCQLPELLSLLQSSISHQLIVWQGTVSML